MVSQELIIYEYVSLSSKFPRLHPPIFLSNQKIWKIAGSIDLIDDSCEFWNDYEIEIQIPQNYPEKPPVLIEISNKVPKNSDWHNRGSCCVAPEALIYHKLEGKLTLISWMEEFVIPYFANHVYRRETNAYANGEYSHATPGIIEGYKNIFNIDDNTEVYKTLEHIYKYLDCERNDKCFCMSGKKFKKCYMLSPYSHQIEGIPIDIIVNDFIAIKKHRESPN
jgi:hypothetical protein